MLDSKDWSEFLEARALIKAFESQLQFESTLLSEIEEIRHA